VNLVDLLALAAIAIATVIGFRIGALRQIGALTGAFLGLAVTFLITTVVFTLLPDIDALSRAITTLVLGLVAMLLGRQVGVNIASRALPEADPDAAWWHGIDRAGGVVVAGCQAVLIMWVVAGLMSLGVHPKFAATIDRSFVVSALSSVAPKPGAVAQRLQRSVLNSEAVNLLATLGVSMEPARLPSGERSKRIATNAQPSTMKVVTTGCEWQSQGSGVVIADHYVVTNAHVVDGGHNVSVVDGQGATHDARVVGFQARLDAALLYVPELTAPALDWTSGAVARGDVGIALGYPGGGPLVATRASVNRQTLTTGVDPATGAPIARQVVELHSRVAPGDSGGPFVLTDGTIGGIVFAESPDKAAIGYALPVADVSAFVDPLIGRKAPVNVGPC